MEDIDSDVADFLVKFNTSESGITLFLCVAIAFIICEICIINLIKLKTRTVSSNSSLIRKIQKFLPLTQYVLTANIVILIFQMLADSKYPVAMLIFGTLISNVISAFLFLLFAIRFLSWYRNPDHNSIILIFTLSFFILGFLNFMAGIGDSYLLLEKGQISSPYSPVEYHDFPEGSFFNRFYDYYDYLDYASFVMLLIAIGSMLYHYGKKINKSKLIVIMALPLLSYTSSILDALNIYDTDTAPQLFIYYIFQSATTISGGVLFAISFWYVSAKLPSNSVKSFLRITALGFILLFITNHVSVSLASYPPFGINSLSLLPLSTYVLLLGLYSTAISLSQDISLRRMIRSLARSDNNLLSSIGTAEMSVEVSKAVNKLKGVVEKEGKILTRMSGIEVPIEEKEIEEYVRQVSEEIMKSKKPDNY